MTWWTCDVPVGVIGKEAHEGVLAGGEVELQAAPLAGSDHGRAGHVDLRLWERFGREQRMVVPLDDVGDLDKG
ncbi:MAG TPA: hypothetical protein VF152_02175 [Acidimicrobiia bacterium]